MIIYYTVGSSETLYAIARKNEVTVDDIKKWNNLTDKSFIHKGDRLIVGLISLKKAKPEDVVTIKSPEKIDTKKPKKDDDEDYIDEKYKKQNNNSKDKTETKEISEKTVASWIDDGTLVSAKSLALHTTAPEGTIMKVTNMMNKKSVYVKIVGNIPAGEENNVTIKMTRTAAEKLGAIDKFFRVELHYAAEVIKDKKK
ncbi:MAG: LysM peptidoglycan-binding domain-containing protein [Bacteroidetes bacterium]|nr:LysM peptidoglycan-binding domain-containing protein [Bacteroidota bacterium]